MCILLVAARVDVVLCDKHLPLAVVCMHTCMMAAEHPPARSLSGKTYLQTCACVLCSDGYDAKGNPRKRHLRVVKAAVSGGSKGIAGMWGTVGLNGVSCRGILGSAEGCRQPFHSCIQAVLARLRFALFKPTGILPACPPTVSGDKHRGVRGGHRGGGASGDGPLVSRLTTPLPTANTAAHALCHWRAVSRRATCLNRGHTSRFTGDACTPSFPAAVTRVEQLTRQDNEEEIDLEAALEAALLEDALPQAEAAQPPEAVPAAAAHVAAPRSAPAQEVQPAAAAQPTAPVPAQEAAQRASWPMGSPQVAAPELVAHATAAVAAVVAAVCPPPPTAAAMQAAVWPAPPTPVAMQAAVWPPPPTPVARQAAVWPPPPTPAAMQAAVQYPDLAAAGALQTGATAAQLRALARALWQAAERAPQG